MLMINYNEAVDTEVMEALDKCSLANYTKIMGVYGKGGSSGTHMGDDIWPGRNNILYVTCGDDLAVRLMAAVRDLRTTLGKEGVKAFVWDLCDFT